MNIKRICKLIVLFLLCFIFFLKIDCVQAASDLTLKNLNFDVTANEDGSINVKEIWNIRIEDTNTLFKEFSYDNADSERISYKDVKVAEIKADGTRKEFEQTSQYAYHLKKGTYYGLNRGDYFEIAWGISETSVTRTYEISYKITNAFVNQEDCSELYWQLIGDKFEIPVTNFTATIKLPEGAYQKEDIRAWAHGPLNGNVTIKDANTIELEVTNLPRKTMVEVRILTPQTVFRSLQNATPQKSISKITSEETIWAAKANDIRMKNQEIERQRKEAIKQICIILLVISIVAMTPLIYAIVKKTKLLKETKKITPNQKVQYYREIPNEKTTPGEAGFLYYFQKSTFKMNMPKILSATMLDLSLKQYIEFEMKKKALGKDDIVVKLTQSEEINRLEYHERTFYNLLKRIAEENNKRSNATELEFTMKDLEKYASKYNARFLKVIGSIETEIEEEQEAKGNYDIEMKKQIDVWHIKASVYLVLGMCTLPIITISIPAIINSIMCFKMGSKFKTFTQKGEDELELWNGLKRYMQDFSLLKEREVPEIALWEKYLIYATAFGIAEKVLKQLKVKYPEFSNEDYLSHTYGNSYMYFMFSSSLSRSFSNSINNSMSTATSYARGNYSSGGGYGRWIFWPEAAEDLAGGGGRR